jgi:creatinine amidohydrolase
MRLQLATWVEVESYLTRSNTIVMPIGSTEQHGPNGLLGTDAITAEEIAWRVGEAAGIYVGPTISVGMAQHHLGFAGSVSLRPTTLIAVIGDYVTSLARSGFRRFFFINGHGGNIAPASTAFSEIYARASFGDVPEQGIRCTLQNWWDNAGVRRLSSEYYGAGEGQHATASEVAVTQFVYPNHIKTAVLDPEIAPTMGSFTDSANYRSLYPDGRIGSNPGLARPEHGEKLIAEAVGDLVGKLQRFAAG